MQNKKIRFTIVVCFFASLTSSCLNAQSFSAEDLLKIYTSNSDTLKQVCIRKDYFLQDSTFINNAKTYVFWSNDKNRLRFDASFLENGMNANSVNYWLKKRSELKELKKSFTGLGFKFVGNKDLRTPGNTFMERYVRDDIQVEIISSTANPPFWVIVHNVKKYAGW
ncbi:hypothetical protein [Niabella aquatica]